MAKLIYSAITSLDGYVADEDGNFDWAAPDDEVHAFVNDLERPVGTYARQLAVSRGLALDAITATYADGVLTLSIPVAEEAKPRRIEVQHAGDANRITAGAHTDA